MIQSLNIVSEDHRRIIAELGAGDNWKVCKYLLMKEDGIVGKHYHKNKRELFLVVYGKLNEVRLNENVYLDPQLPCVIDVRPNTYHEFNMCAGTVLVCLSSEEHDDNDDYKWE